MRLLFSFLLLFVTFAPAGFQTPVEPIRVLVLELADGERTRQLAGDMRSELQKLRYVIPAKRDARRDYTVLSAASSLDDAQCKGLVGVMVVIDERDPKGGSSLSTHFAGDTKSLARHLVEKLNREYFNKRRRSSQD